MRLLASLLVLLVPLAFCQYQNQRYPQQQYNGQQQPYGQQQYGQQQQGQRIQPMNQQQGYQNQMNGGYQQNGQQQNGQFYPGQMNGRSQKAQIGRTEVVNTPTRLLTSEAASGTDGAQVEFRITAYRNPDLSLSNITTCNCPVASCEYLSPTAQNNCQFSFMTVISAKDQSVQFIQSDFFPVGPQGEPNSGNWTNNYSFSMPSKPVAVDIFVQHLGVVIEKYTAALKFFNHLTLVDEFVVDIASYIPTQNQQQKTYTLTGKRLNTQMNIVMSVSCINGRMGESCDLSCNTTASTDNVICTDTMGRNSSCRWSNTYKTQVTDCRICEQIGANGTCAGVIVSHEEGVSYAFRTWTIVLGVLLGLSLLCIICLIITYIVLRSRDNRYEESSTTYKPQKDNYANGNGKANRPLLDDEWQTTTTTVRRPILPEPGRTDDRYGREVASSVSRQEHQV